MTTRRPNHNSTFVPLLQSDSSKIQVINTCERPSRNIMAGRKNSRRERLQSRSRRCSWLGGGLNLCGTGECDGNGCSSDVLELAGDADGHAALEAGGPGRGVRMVYAPGAGPLI